MHDFGGPVVLSGVRLLVVDHLQELREVNGPAHVRVHNADQLEELLRSF